MENKFVLNDINEFVKKFDLIEQLKNKSILITGGTGLIGSSLIKYIAYASKQRKLDIEIFGMARSKEKVLSKNFPDNVTWIYQDMKRTLSDEIKVDYIIHTASPTQSKYMISHPVELINDTYIGTRNLLEYAKEHNITKFVYLSSIEVYGQMFENKLVTEENNGYIDQMNVRSCYSEGKRLIECLCSSYADEYNIPVNVARLTQTFGAGVAFDDNRVYSQFCHQILKGDNIILHTDGESAKNYLYISDAVTGLITILLKGNVGEAYNLCNEENYISIYDLANFLVNNFNKDVSVNIEKKENEGYAPVTKVNLSSSKLRKLGWMPSSDLKDSFTKLLNYFSGKDIEDKEK